MKKPALCTHPVTLENVDAEGRCRECHRIRERRRYYRLKGIRLTAAQFERTGRKRTRA